MQEKEMKTIKKNKSKISNGITLIALVVTIVVLLILAGVSIVVLFGEHGIITVANQAANDHKLAFYMDKFEVVKTSVATQNAGKVPIEKFKDALINEKVVTAEQITGNNTDGYIATPEEDVKITMKQAEDGKNVTIKYELTNENGTTGGGSGEGSGEGGGDNPGGEGTNPDDPYQGADKESNWNLLGEIAKAIAQDPEINSDSIRATGITESGKKYDISVGDEFKIRYDKEEILRTVRIIGFKHDRLADKTVYGGTHEKAGITFDFLDFLLESEISKMNEESTNSGGWAKSLMRERLNGYSTTDGDVGGIATKLSNSSVIKKVKKDYIPITSGLDCEAHEVCDYLWLLSRAEIWTGEAIDERYGQTNGKYPARDGQTYVFYKNITMGKSLNTKIEQLRKKFIDAETFYPWFLRTTNSNNWQGFQCVLSNGVLDNRPAALMAGIAPGFCV